MFLLKEEIIQGTKEILQDKSFYSGKLVLNVSLPVEAYKKRSKRKNY